MAGAGGYSVPPSPNWSYQRDFSRNLLALMTAYANASSFCESLALLCASVDAAGRLSTRH